MTKIKKPHCFYCEIYMVNIYFYHDICGDGVSASMKKFLNVKFDSTKFDKLAGKALEIDGGDYVIYIKDKKMISVLAHESLHVANMILSNKGIVASYENDEAQAYLLGWIMKKCLEFTK